MTKAGRRSAHWPVAQALACVLALAACGVDGEPEQPTRAMLAPTDLATTDTAR